MRKLLLVSATVLLAACGGSTPEPQPSETDAAASSKAKADVLMEPSDERDLGLENAMRELDLVE